MNKSAHVEAGSNFGGIGLCAARGTIRFIPSQSPPAFFLGRRSVGRVLRHVGGAVRLAT